MSVDGGRAEVSRLTPRPVVTPGERSPFVATPVWVHVRRDAGEITATDLHVYGTVARHAHNSTRYARLFQATIAREAGTSLATVSRAIARLIRAGCITAERRGQGHPNRYFLPWDDPRELSTTPELDTSPMTYQSPPTELDTSPMTRLDTSPMTYITRYLELETPPALSVTAQGGGHARAGARAPEVQPPLMYPQTNDNDHSAALAGDSPPGTPASPPTPPPERESENRGASGAADDEEGAEQSRSNIRSTLAEITDTETMPTRQKHPDDLAELMPVQPGDAGRYWVECPWCGEGADYDRAWRCYRWRETHVCTDDAPLHQR
jgi:hypothetical protein